MTETRDSATADEAAYAEWRERQPVPCCGQPECYCECSPHVRDYALIVAAAMDERVEPMAADDPRRDELPPF